MIQLLLPGANSIYYGEEIQMSDNLHIVYGQSRDLLATDAGPTDYKKVSRDPFRCPMQWNLSIHAG